MSTVRRWYIYLVSAISVIAVGIAVSHLLGNLVNRAALASVGATALQLAVIVVGLPIYLAHWLWAQWLAARDADERGAALRWLYLYGLLAWSLGAALAAAWSVVEVAVGVLSARDTFFGRTDPLSVALDWAPAVLVWGALWLYHRYLITANRRAVGETEWAGALRRLTIYGYSAAGLAMTVTAIVALLARLIDTLTGSITAIAARVPVQDVTSLLVGLPVWLVFWLAAQRLFAGPDGDERASTVRKVYLYAVIFVAVAMAVGTATLLLGYGLQKALGVPVESRGLGQWLALIMTGLAVWGYHASVLRQDGRMAGTAPQEAAIRRVYLYLVAGIGLAALLIGLAGNLSVLIRSLAGPGLIQDLRAQMAWFTAALIAGLPVWLLAWRPAQAAAMAPAPHGIAERQSVTRKIYLYIFLFTATLTILSSAVFVVSRVLSWILSGHVSGNPISEIGQAVAFTLIAAFVWLYHGMLLRHDGRTLKADEAQRLQGIRVVVLDAGDGRYGASVVEALRRRLPGLALAPMGLTPQAVGSLGAAVNTPEAADALTHSNIIVAPWSIMMPSGANPEIATAIAASPARKVLIPTAFDGWLLAGASDGRVDDLVDATVANVAQLAAGEEVHGQRPMGAAKIVLLAIAALFGLCIASQIVASLVSLIVYR